MWGCGPFITHVVCSRRILEKSDVEGEIPVDETYEMPSGIQSRAGHVKPGLKQGGPSPKAKYYLVTDSEQYREGKVKRTPGGE